MTSMNSLVLKALFNFSISILISTSIKIFSVMWKVKFLSKLIDKETQYK
jgi:hypothetical protein